MKEKEKEKEKEQEECQMENREGYWIEDQNTDQDEVDTVNAALKEVAPVDPRFLKLIWDKK